MTFTYVCGEISVAIQRRISRVSATSPLHVAIAGLVAGVLQRLRVGAGQEAVAMTG